jgi:hypothetical protein
LFHKADRSLINRTGQLDLLTTEGICMRPSRDQRKRANVNCIGHDLLDLAVVYLITFTCYGRHLHGDEQGLSIEHIICLGAV